MSQRSFTTLLAGALMGAGLLTAQTASSTCPTPPAGVANLSLEHVLSFSSLFTPYQPNIAPNVFAAIMSGTQEIRSRVIYYPATNTLNNDVFLVPVGSPIPTPSSTDVSGTTFAILTSHVDKVYTACTPYPSVMFVGTVTFGLPLFGNPAGEPVSYSIGYTGDNPPKINTAVQVVAGLVSSYQPANIYGTITFPAVPATPVTPVSAGPPVIVVSPSFPAAGVTQVTSSPYLLDASKSTDPGGLALTYQWSSTNTVSFSPSPTSPTPILTFQGGYSDYPITLTVTNSAGVSAKSTFTLEYLR